MNREFFHRLKAEPDQQKRLVMLDAMLVAEGVKSQAEVDEVNNAATDTEKRAALMRQSDEHSARFSVWLKSYVENICRPEWHTLSRKARLEAARIHHDQHFPSEAQAAACRA